VIEHYAAIGEQFVAHAIVLARAFVRRRNGNDRAAHIAALFVICTRWSERHFYPLALRRMPMREMKNPMPRRWITASGSPLLQSVRIAHGPPQR